MGKHLVTRPRNTHWSCGLREDPCRAWQLETPSTPGQIASGHIAPVLAVLTSASLFKWEESGEEGQLRFDLLKAGMLSLESHSLALSTE